MMVMRKRQADTGKTGQQCKGRPRAMWQAGSETAGQVQHGKQAARLQAGSHILSESVDGIGGHIH
jgi:hypothetical protein